jgi:DNA invertase Pin-like site-specific DNA recombinase
VLSDEDQSASSRNRPQFGVARQRILAGEADVIIVWKVSRFSRAWPEDEDV